MKSKLIEQKIYEEASLHFKGISDRLVREVRDKNRPRLRWEQGRTFGSPASLSLE